MIKQLVGIIFLLVFLYFLGYKFYMAVKDMEYASLITFASVIIVLLAIIGVGKQLRGY